MTQQMSGTITAVPGSRGALALHSWTAESPTFVVLLAHGYGEHAGRYAHVAGRLVDAGGAVYAPDHVAPGRSAGERAQVELLEDMVTDLGAIAKQAAAEHAGRWSWSGTRWAESSRCGTCSAPSVRRTR